MAEAGDRFRLTGRLGDGPGSMITGQVVTIAAFVPADEAGAHDNTEDSYIVEWEEPAQVLQDDGTVGIGTARRAVSVGVGDFDTIFEEVTDAR